MSGDDTLPSFAAVIADLLEGKRHSRATIRKRTGKSFSAVDRWIKMLKKLPGVRDRKDGRTTWISIPGMQAAPTRAAAVGACIATSLAGLFEGTANERNLRDARDYMIRGRGETYADLDRKFVFAPRGGEYALPENAGNFDEIVEALLNTRKLRFTYTHNDRREESLTLSPLSLLLFDHQFYVVCRREDGSHYCYRFARMKNVDATARSFSYPDKNEYEPRRLLEPGFGVHISGSGPVLEIKIQLTEPWANFALTHRWHPTQEARIVRDGVVLLQLRVRHCREVETWILGLGECATVVEPKSLRDAIGRRVGLMVRRYEDQGVDAPRVARAKKGPGAGPSKTKARKPDDARNAGA